MPERATHHHAAAARLLALCSLLRSESLGGAVRERWRQPTGETLRSDIPLGARRAGVVVVSSQSARRKSFVEHMLPARHGHCHAGPT